MPIRQSLRVARITAGITHRDLASALGLVPTAIGNYEAGRRNLTPERQELWRAALKQLLAARASAIANHLATL